MLRRTLIAFLVFALVGGGAYLGCDFIAKPAWTPRHPTNRIPSAAMQSLGEPTTMVLYSLHPADFAGPAGDPARFRGYRILGETILDSPEARRATAVELRDAVRAWNGLRATCIFSPRHGVRATDAAGVHEFLICFECGEMEVSSPGGGGHVMLATRRGSPLTELLRAANVPLPDE